MLAMQRRNASADLPAPALNHSDQRPLLLEALSSNGTHPPSSATGAVLSMTLGMVFNVTALIILAKAYKRFRRRSKATFLLFASSLVATDLAGHLIAGALVLRRYTSGAGDPSPRGETDASCMFMGGCMVFFGLCPLFLGCAMATERCMGVTRPLLHARLVSTARTKMALAFIWLLALGVSILPFFSLGAYTYQHPGTWCFIRVTEGTRGMDLIFVVLFSSLAFSSMAMALVCNTISGVTLVKARLKKTAQRCSARSHDTEMVVQLLGIMVACSICWGPLLVLGLMLATSSYRGTLGNNRENYKTLMLTFVRMASCNQILDPWVYILLRRAVLQKIYRITKKQASFKRSTLRSLRLDLSSLQGSDKSNKIAHQSP
ncbi:prostaglandin E2 receptor EP1 subtype-like isoform 1-T2 [Synchiropus picturatus]